MHSLLLFIIHNHVLIITNPTENYKSKKMSSVCINVFSLLLYLYNFHTEDTHLAVYMTDLDRSIHKSV